MLSSVARMFVYGSVAAALPVLRKKQPQSASFRLPDGVAFSALALLFTAVLITRMRRGEFIVILATATLAFANWLWATQHAPATEPAADADITNQVNDQFAAAGRDLSPGNSYYLARGLGAGIAPTIASQANANANNQLAAANTLFGAGNTTASGLTGLAQTQLGNELQGASLAGQVPGLLLGPAQAQLAAATAAQNLPLQNLAPYESLLTPLAALGSQTSGSSQGTTTQSVPLSQQIVGGAIGGLGLLNALGLPLPKLFGGTTGGGGQNG